jgi:hypothetical protein
VRSTSLLEERRDRFARRVALARQRQAHRQDGLRIVAERHLLNVHEASEEESGTEQQHHGQRDLDDDEPLTNAAGARRAGAPVGFQRIVRIGSCGLHAGRTPTRQRRHGGEHQAPDQHARVQPRVQTEHLELRRNDGAGELQTGIGDGQAAGRPREREQAALGEQLSCDPRPCGAKRQTNGELPLPCRRARQLQVRDVDAGDEQHEEHRADEQQGRGPDLARQRGGPRCGRQPPAVVFLERRHGRLLHRSRGCRELRVRLLQRRRRD